MRGLSDEKEAKEMVSCDNGVLLRCPDILYDGLRLTKFAVDRGVAVWTNGWSGLLNKNDWPRGGVQ